jgi:hypothetical protein
MSNYSLNNLNTLYPYTLDGLVSVSADEVYLNGVAVNTYTFNSPIVQSDDPLSLTNKIVDFDYSTNNVFTGTNRFTTPTFELSGLTGATGANIVFIDISNNGLLSYGAVPSGSTGATGATGAQGQQGFSSGLVLYFNSSVPASVSGYLQVSDNAVIGAGSTIVQTTNGLIASFITDVGEPNITSIVSGNWNFEQFVSMSANGGTPTLYVDILKRDLSGVETLIATNSSIPHSITEGVIIEEYFFSVGVPITSMLTTDRLVFKFYAGGLGGKTMTLYYENSTIAQVSTTLSPALQGATGATGATGASFNIINNSSTATIQYLTFAGSTGSPQIGIDTALTYQPSTNILTCGSVKPATIRDISNNTGASNQVLNAISGGGGIVWSYPTPASLYGDGADGAVHFNNSNQYPFSTFDGMDTYTLIRDVWATTIIVDSITTVITAGYRLFAQNSINNGGSIHNNGSDGNGTVGGIGGLGGFFKAGGNGSAGLGTASAGANGTSQATPTADTWVGGVGGKGGQGRAGNTTFTGGQITTSNLDLSVPPNANGGSKTTSNFVNYLTRYIVGATNWQMTPSIGGGSGAKSTTGTTATSGGGGGGGGVLVVASPIIFGSGSINAVGGWGGNATGTGGNFGGGGGGGGGICCIIARTITNTFSANGGVGGATIYTAGTGDIPVATSNGSNTTLTGTLTLNPTQALSKGKLYMLTFHLQKTGGIGPSGINGITGYGMNWNLISGSRVEYNSILLPTRVQETWYGYYTTGTPDLIENRSITVALSDINTTARVIIDEITNVDATSLNNPVQTGNIATNSSNSATALTITLPFAPTAGNMVYSVFTRATGTLPVAGANNTLVNNQTVAPLMVSEVNTTGQQANAMSHTTASAIAGFSVEILKTTLGANEGSAGWNGKVVRIFG